MAISLKGTEKTCQDALMEEFQAVRKGLTSSCMTPFYNEIQNNRICIT